jgi:hydrogenase nickel incorporation protein HypB
MCKTCGCSDTAHEHDHSHGAHEHPHPHDGDHSHAVISLEQRLLARNEQQARRNRQWLAERGILALNFVSSPGSGKTTLLERMLRDLGRQLTMRVIEGDQATDHDAQRIRSAGGQVFQINTGTGCHLDAGMVARGLQALDPPERSMVLIENVGNLVCPALFDLGEHAKVVVCSVTEGDDKPIKYPHMFRAGRVLVLNKIDLLPHVTFHVARFLDFAHQVNPKLHIFQVSATRGDGLEDWYDWLRGEATEQGHAEAVGVTPIV